MLQRPVEGDYLPVQSLYIGQVPEGDLLAILQEQQGHVLAILNSLTEEQANFRYETDKWSVKQVIGHIADNERIMSYRLLRIARGDSGTSLPGYDQDVLVPLAPFEGWSIDQLKADYEAVRQATLTLLRGLRPSDWEREGIANGGRMTVLSFACINVGHEQHHLRILRERYHIG